MVMWTGLGDNTKLFWAVLSQRPARPPGAGPALPARASASKLGFLLLNFILDVIFDEFILGVLLDVVFL
jgi:hypothetical protein